MLGARYRFCARVGHQNTQNTSEVTSQNNIVFFRAHGLSERHRQEGGIWQEELTLVVSTLLIKVSVTHNHPNISPLFGHPIYIPTAQLGQEPYPLSKGSIFYLELSHSRRKKPQLNSFQTEGRYVAWDTYFLTPTNWPILWSQLDVLYSIQFWHVLPKLVLVA